MSEHGPSLCKALDFILSTKDKETEKGTNLNSYNMGRGALGVEGGSVFSGKSRS